MPEHYQGASPKLPLLLEWWKPVVGWEAGYDVSNVGRVWDKVSGRCLRYYLDYWKYPYVCLSLNGKKQKKKLHRLVAEAFLEPSKKPEVNHKDGNKLNPKASNLEFMTRRENYLHAVETGLMDGFLVGRTLTDDDARSIRLSSLSNALLAKLHNVHPSHISKIRHRKKFAHVA